MNVENLADSYQRNNGITTEDLTPPLATFALALIDKDGNILLHGGEGAGVMLPRMARATFDPSSKAAHRTIAPHGLGVFLPKNAIILGGFIDVKTTFTSATDAATVAITTESAGDIKAAIAISNGANPWDAGKQPIIPKANTPELTSISVSAKREITATVAVEALTAGKANIYILYWLAP
jgi:hypothetical protein